MKKTSVQIVKILKKAGHEAYWAGGTVRDLLMGKNPKDYDIATSAKPEEIENLLEKTIPVGKKFGVIIAVKNNYRFEIATFRSDSSYTDGRRPDAILFTSSEEDAKRRDFTINGMFYDPTTDQIFDYVGGQKDLKDQVIRFIGKADERLKEDNLRILRAIRFKNSLGFSYSKETFEAIKKNALLIKKVKSERIQDELNKILLLPGRENAFREMDEAGILKYVLPELLRLKGVKQPEKYHQEGDVFTHSILCLEALPDKISLELAWATLLHDIGKPDTFSIKERIRFDGHAEEGEKITDKIAKRLKFSRFLRENVKWLVKHHMTVGNIFKMTPTHRLEFIHHPLFGDLLELLRADELGSEPTDLSLYEKLRNIYLKKEDLLPKPKKIISGNYLKQKFKIPEGPELGYILDELYQAQVEGKIRSKKEAIALAKKIAKK